VSRFPEFKALCKASGRNQW